MKPLNLTGTHICNSLALKSQAQLSFISAELHPINLPDIQHETARRWGQGEEEMMGEGRSGTKNKRSCMRLASDHTTERKALFKFVCHLHFPSLSSHSLSLHPSLPSST